MMKHLKRYLAAHARELCWATLFDIACFAAAFFAGTQCHAQQVATYAPPARAASASSRAAGRAAVIFGFILCLTFFLLGAATTGLLMRPKNDDYDENWGQK